MTVIDIPVQVFYRVDEIAQIGVLDGRCAKFENNVYVTPISVDDAVNKYLEIGTRIPDEFVAVREAVSQKLAKMQSLL